LFWYGGWGGSGRYFAHFLFATHYEGLESS
jgi:hypothetical protein